MSSIRSDREFFTLINVFSVAPEDQQKLIDLLTEATSQTMTKLPGFVSANIHRSFDGRKVVNYARWESQAHFEAMRQNPEAIPHMQAAGALASAGPIVCEVVEHGVSTKH
jgi:heme-degrading monooxygenase HmoA